MRDTFRLLAAVTALTTVGACSPLPGASLDPLYLKTAAAPASIGAPASAPAGNRRASTAVHDLAPVWTGRYRDNRGEGEMTLTITPTETGFAGAWRLRTGGGGRLVAIAQPGGPQLSLHMESESPQCSAELDGWVEIADVTLVGAYHGKDCYGPVSDGRFDLRRQ